MAFTDSGIGDFFQNLTGLVAGVTPTIVGAINPEDAYRYGYPNGYPYGSYNGGIVPVSSGVGSQQNLLVIGAIVIGAYLLLRSR